MRRITGLPRADIRQDWHEWADQLVQALEAGAGDGEIGQVAEFGVLPPGWLPADGSTFSATAHPQLAKFLGGTTLPTFAPVYDAGNVVGIKA